ncbi:MAG: GNAT family N-acetyltransferase [Bacteroides sp.]
MIKEEVKALWKLCFDDSEDFIEMYFRLRYNNETSIAIESGEEVIAALQMIPYPMTFCGKAIQTSYISGACTHPDYRGNGVMRELLSQAFVRMLRSDVAVSTLIPGEPWLFDYYARLGYAPVFGYSSREIPANKAPRTSSISVRSTVDYEQAVYLYLNKKMEKHPCCIQHTEADFKVILEDLALENNAVYIATRKEQVVGVAVAYQTGNELQLPALFTDTEEIENELLYKIQKMTGCKRLTVLTPPAHAAKLHLLGMARIIDIRRILQLYAAAYPSDEMNIELTDEQLSTNNGYYYLCSGKCMYNKERLPGTHLKLSIGELSEKILAPLQPYMSLMLD